MTPPQDDLLLDKLQATIHLWSDEVSQAHSGLTQQISETRSQLDTLIHTIADRTTAPGNTPDSNSADHSRANTSVEYERIQIALSETIAHNKLLLQDLDALKANYLNLQHKHKHTVSLNKKLATSLKALKAREDQLTAQRDTARNALEKLDVSKGRRDENIQHVQDEMQHLIQTANQAIALQEELLRERDALAKKNNDLQTQCDTSNLLQNQHAELQQQLQTLQTELADKSEDLNDARTRIAELESDRSRVSDDLLKAQAQIEHLQDHAQLAAAETIQALKADLEEKNAALALLQTELNEILATQTPVSALESENTKLKSQLAHLKQSELDLKSELASLGQEYERQADVLREAVREVETHWQIESRAKDAEQRLKHDMDALNDQLKEKSARIHQLEQEIVEKAAIALPPPITASGKTEGDLEEFHMDLITLENFLEEREKAIEGTAKKMISLEETALAVQAEVTALQQERQHRIHEQDTLASQTLQKADEEITLLKKSIDQQASVSGAQQKVIDEQNDAITRFQTELAELQTARQDAAADQLTKALNEIESLKQTLSQRETELAQTRAKPDLPAEPLTFAAFDDTGKQRSMGEILVDAGIINTDQLYTALKEQQSSGQRRLGSILVEKGHIREEIVAQVVASQLKLPFVRIKEENVDRETVSLLTSRLAALHMAFPIRTVDDQVIIAMANPLDLIAVEDLEFATHKKIAPVVATHTDIAHAIVNHYGISIPANAPQPKSAAPPRTATPARDTL